MTLQSREKSLFRLGRRFILGNSPLH